MLYFRKSNPVKRDVPVVNRVLNGLVSFLGYRSCAEIHLDCCRKPYLETTSRVLGVYSRTSSLLLSCNIGTSAVLVSLLDDLACTSLSSLSPRQCVLVCQGNQRLPFHIGWHIHNVFLQFMFCDVFYRTVSWSFISYFCFKCSAENDVLLFLVTWSVTFLCCENYNRFWYACGKRYSENSFSIKACPVHCLQLLTRWCHPLAHSKNSFFW